MKLKDGDLLFHRLRLFPGSYECHMTVELEQDQLAQFKAICKALGGSALIIILDTGEYPTQPMLAKILSGRKEDVMTQIKRIYFRLAESFNVTRVKIETDLNCVAVPQTEQQAESLPDDCYFEFHTRLKLSLEEDIEKLRESAKLFSGHLSNNALSKNEHYQQRFVTQRFRKLGKEKAVVELDKLLLFLESKDLTVDKVIREFNIFDSNTYLDFGWENAN